MTRDGSASPHGSAAPHGAVARDTTEADPVGADPILIWGAGAIGGTLGAYWTRAGVAVLMVDIVESHVAACRTEGLRITGPIEQFSVVVPAMTLPELRSSGRKFSRIVLAVKALATEQAVGQLAPFLADDGYVLSAQNGLNELVIAARVGAERTMGCFVNFGADWHGPGEILYGNRGAVVVGEIDRSIRQRTRDMHALLASFEPDAVLTDNIYGYLWGKLAYGAMLIATALTPDSMSANFADPRRRDVFVRLACEVMAVAAAREVEPVGFGRFEPRVFMPGGSGRDRIAAIDWLAEYTSHGAKTHSGIWRDLAVRKRQTEVETQIGIIGALGDEVGIATPALARMRSLVLDIEQGRRRQSFDTFAVLIELCKTTPIHV